MVWVVAVPALALSRIPMAGILGVPVPPDDVPTSDSPRDAMGPADEAPAAERAATLEAAAPRCFEVVVPLAEPAAPSRAPPRTRSRTRRRSNRHQHLCACVSCSWRMCVLVGLASSLRRGPIQDRSRLTLSSSPPTSKLCPRAALLRGLALPAAPASLLGDRTSE